MTEVPFFYTDTPASSSFVVDVPSNVSLKSELLEIVGIGLHFPDYYGHNWDAFEECIRDLSWLPEYDIIVRHVDIPLLDDTSNAAAYLAILRDAAQKWTPESAHHLKVLFPLQSKSVIENLIDQK